ncbi:hypothetical protein BGZ97_003787 [Linnemannia gamsii]|jgi:hypothetical protein|uniref:Uncharacterized protein n=1 Tax=Linnemannia gamsii TaxID=64522 RepID=A0A9P6UT15_9FUNG|nr:hypothetical protein BGZ97_003787 [Linnemannia gamsii]
MTTLSAIPDQPSTTPSSSLALDVQSILTSDSATLDPSMTKDQILEIGKFLTTNNARITRLTLSEGFKDLQGALKEFFELPCCSQLETLEYKAGGSSFAQILLATSSTALDTPVELDQVRDSVFVAKKVPFIKTLRNLRLGYNSDSPQAKTDIAVFNGLLKHTSELESFVLAQPLDSLALLEGLSTSLPRLTKLSIAVNNESGLEEEEVFSRIKYELLPGIKDLEVEIDERESSYYLNLSRDRHFQAFIRRFGGERKQQA